MHLTSLAAFKVALCIAHGLPVPFIVKIILDDLADQALNAPRRLPWFSTGNALGFNCPREYQHYGWPYYGAAQSGIRPSLSREEFRSHFLFPSIVAALRAADRYHPIGHPQHVILGGFDGDATAYKMLREGYLDATGVQDVYFEASQAVQAVLDMKAGKQVADEILDPGFVIHQDNLAEMAPRMWGAQVGP